jgi:NAD(P)H-dependent FMN reductase
MRLNSQALWSMKPMNNQVKVALIYGSTREGRFCDKVAQWAQAQIANRSEFSLNVIDPKTLALPIQHERKERSELTALRRRIERADAFVIVTPEYNHGYPVALKSLIDSVYDEWLAKPVAFVSYGGISGGLRAVEQLRLVFAELHAVTIRDSLSFANAWEQFNAAGELLEPNRARKSMATLLAQLHWWAVALRDARNAAPYGQAAA